MALRIPRAPLLPLLVLLWGFPAPAEDAIVPGENLVADGIPSLPRSLAERAGPYMEFRSATFQGWNPLRLEMLITTRFGDVPQLHRVSTPAGARTQLTFLGERILGGRYRPKSADIVFMKDVGGGEWYQLYLRDDRTGKVTLLMDGKSRNTAGPFTKSGTLLAYGSTRQTGRRSDIWVMNPSDPAGARMVLEGSGERWAALDWSPDDKRLLVGEFVSVEESRLWLVDVATGAKSLLSPESKEKVAWRVGRFSADGKTVYATSDAGREFSHLVAVDVATRKVEDLTPGLVWDVDGIDLAPDGTKIAYSVNEGGASTLHALDLGTRKEIAVPNLPFGTIAIGGLRWCPMSRRLGFTFTSAKSPADAYAVDTATGKLERWTESETGGLDAAAFVEPEAISWKSFDGRSIGGLLYRPPPTFEGPRPVVISIHGGPESQHQPGFLGRNNYLLNELGIAIVFPNVRGSTGYGKTFVGLDNGVLREDSVKDIGALLDWIGVQPGLDRSRVMVAGGSYGGYMTLATMTHYNDRLRCAVDVVGISNFVTFLESTEAYRRDLRRVEYGDERDPKMREFLQKISPLTNAAKITKPIFVVQGKNDPRVPWTEAEQMVNAIKKNGGPVWFLIAKDEGHGFSKKRNQDFQFYAMLEFLGEYLVR